MKKILSMVLCILMVMSVFAIPMTVSASTATEAVFDPTTTNFYSVDYVRADGSTSCWDDAYVYSWTPAATGVLTLVPDSQCSDYYVIVENASNWFDGTALDTNATAEGVTFNVTAGTTYNVTVMTWSENSGVVSFYAYFEEKAAGGLTGAGTYENPYVIDSTVESLPATEYGATAYYLIDADAATTHNLSVRGGGMMDSFDLFVQNNNTTVSSMMGSATVENIAPFMATGKILFCITNTALGAGGPYTFTLTANEASTLGTEADPDTLVLDTITTCDITGVNYYYTYTATEDGTLSLEFMITNDWVCSISGGAAEAVFCASDDATVVNPVTYPVTAGEEITVWVATTSYGAGSVYFKALLAVPEVVKTYNVAGEEGLCGIGWDPAQNQMTDDGDGTWSITFTGIAAGTYQFKIVEGGAWGNPDYNLEGNAAGGGANAVVTVEADGSTVVIGFDGEKAVIESVEAPELPPVDDPDQPSSGDEEQPSSGDEEQPSSGDEEKPSSGDEEKPSSGDEEKPSSGDEEKPSSGDEEKPSSGDEEDPATEDEFELGDVNRDGKVNIRDVTLIQKYLAKMEELDEEQMELADFNQDGKISIQDATAIQKMLAHIVE